MINNRITKVFDHEVEDALRGLSDTDILLNFQEAIVKLYPNLIRIYSYASDAWDDFVEPLFYEMVYKTFAYKYGIKINQEETHMYEYSLGNFRGIHRIQCVPKKAQIKVFINFEWKTIEKSDLEKCLFVFNSFGDGKHHISTGLDVIRAHQVRFDLVEVYICSKETGVPATQTILIDKEDLDFEFVAETYDRERNR